MTPERFGQLLARPALLAGQNATELEELIGRFPWCGPLRRLRYEKALLDGDPAAIALWRSRAEPYLQRAHRAERERRIGASAPSRPAVHFDFDADQDPRRAASTPDGEGASPATETPLEPYPEPIHTDLLAAATLAADTAEAVEWYLRRIGNDDMGSARLTPTPKESLDSYRAWKERRARTSWRDLLSAKSKRRDRDTTGAKSGVDAPIRLQPQVASETLAELLAEQGHTDKAVRMYRQLALRYPTRRAAFDARIHQLQQTTA